MFFIFPHLSLLSHTSGRGISDHPMSAGPRPSEAATRTPWAPRVMSCIKMHNVEGFRYQVISIIRLAVPSAAEMKSSGVVTYRRKTAIPQSALMGHG